MILKIYCNALNFYVDRFIIFIYIVEFSALILLGIRNKIKYLKYLITHEI